MKVFGLSTTLATLVVAIVAGLTSAPAHAAAADAATPSTVAPVPVAPMPAAAAQGDYRLRVGDEIAVSVYGEKDLSQTVTVLKGGTISLPLANEVVVGGLTPDGAARAIAAKLKTYMRQPVVTVAVSKEAPVEVLVLGNVVKPGKYPLDSQSRLTDAIAAAGGLGPVNGDYPDARVATASGTISEYSLQKLFRDGDVALNVPVTDNMTVYVPSPPTFDVIVEGAVDKPGDVQLHAGDRLSAAIARAGVSANSNADLNHVKVIRAGPDGKAQTTVVNMYSVFNSSTLAGDVAMQKGDTIVVPSQARKDTVSGPLGIFYVLQGLLHL